MGSTRAAGPVGQDRFGELARLEVSSSRLTHYVEDETRIYSVYETSDGSPTRRHATPTAASEPARARSRHHHHQSTGSSLLNSRRGSPQQEWPAESGSQQAPAAALSPQRVRLANGDAEPHHQQQQRRYRPASADRFGSASQRASRSSLGAAPLTGARVGRFVNYYPASRQPSPSRRQPSPYAFHVPPAAHHYHHYQRASSSNDYHRPQQQVAHGNGLAPSSPSDAYANLSPSTMTGLGSASGAEACSPQAGGGGSFSELAGHDEIELAHGPQQRPATGAAPAARQTHYGYVAAADRVAAATASQQGLARFNKSLRSRTIPHLSSMVQVTMDDELAAANGALAPAVSDSNLLKRHVVVWRRNGELDHDNPFKPGTQLSWEADLMVRLIKRGYPIDQLPSLVEAAKLEAAARAKQQQLAAGAGADYDGPGAGQEEERYDQQQRRQRRRQRDDESTPTGGFLKSNLRQANKAAAGYATGAANPSRPISGAHSHLNLMPAGGKPTDNAAQPPGLHEHRSGRQSALAPDECKAIWANSLRRAKSVPRFSHSEPDADSLDKLITSIEMEIRAEDEYAGVAADQRQELRGQTTTKTKTTKSERAPVPQPPGRLVGAGAKEASLKRKAPERQQAAAKPNECSQLADADRSQNGPAERSATAKWAADERTAQQEDNGKLEKKKRRRCCAIQ
jgi:hypothetical protein